MYLYDAFGLCINSSIAIPELLPSSSSKSDVVLEVAPLNKTPPPLEERGFFFDITSDEAYLYWQQVGGFLVKNGRQIFVEPNPGVQEKIVRMPLLGVVSAVLLHQLGRLVLHASAIAIDGRAVVFVGEKGRGKSTTAATLYSRGHELISDDVVAVDLTSSEEPMVIPGYPQFKLWPDSAISSLGEAPETLVELAPKFEKRARPVTGRFAREALPLGCIFVLEFGDELSAEAISPQEAIVEMIRHSYMSRFKDKLLRGATAKHHLGQCASLASRVPVLRLTRLNSLPSLSSIAELVEAQILQEQLVA